MPDQMVVPPPAPQNEAEGVQAGKDTPKFDFAPNPITGSVGGAPPVHQANQAPPMIRKDGSSARHPMTKRYTNK